ncbi:MAG TPA: 4-hydroxy-tetrahydrodipicolinate synthase [Cyclobacteriaceae bacterium]|nr:4-hydroxy-tetrahydrodipicolinate synthase [Cyclobacteriaceae bacterium]
MKNLKGAGVALVTPFHQDMSIDYAGLERVIEHVIAGGIDYLVVQGTTGESATLTKAEKKEVLKFSIKVNRGRLPIVFGIGGNNTSAILDEIEATEFEGVDAILSVCPYYNKPTQEGLVAHFTKVADACPVPVILYNVPGRTMCNIAAATTLTLTEHHNIIGIKESSGSLEQCMHIAAKKPDDFLLISGDDMWGSALKAMGGEGIISVMANAFPDIISSIIHSDMEGSRKSTFRLLEINPLMYVESNPVGIKCLLNQMELCRDEVRLPLLKASSHLRQKIKDAFSKIH